ncbi:MULTISPECIES: 2-phosphosulfolactate phosphatase [unclassified Meiothermus]|uniref:2-phosphosulfolactate phosphatase n=1 Tax=unclassified Meiothermus TaxID=370471 RepID=UPI000D7CB984|nr:MULTISPECIES: 2-phosphosulfolactate phosphatase [unclassified Meiothermus]PZA08252.1 2-phosphosulfolactate phosphatase [Meiothermus sp. Pnk-1]RYM38994.1 2-phosphosulfolactate phosphatase [Meiothermus sp. PNK-Is4]
MRLRVDLSPNPTYPDLAVVVDVFPGSAVSLLLARGAREVWVAPSLRSARLLAEPGDVLLGEQEGIPPEGFHRGLSFRDLESADMRGLRCVVHAPSLARALAFQAPRAVLGHFRNAKALLAAVPRLAREEVALICAAETLGDPQSAGSGEPSQANMLAAGFFAKRLEQALSFTTMQGASLATHLLSLFPDPQEALFGSGEGQRLHRMGRDEDIALASLIGFDRVVPLLQETRLLEASRYGLSKDRIAYAFTALEGSDEA